MAIKLATGTTLAVASTYGAAVNMTAITNATEAVATLAAGHGVVVGEFLEITSGWDLLNSRIVRAKTVATNDVTLEAVNTSNTSQYPAGTGTGTIRRITAWTNIGQVQSLDTSGGDPNFADITTVSDRTQKQIPTTRQPVSITVTVFDDPLLAYYATVATASDNIAPIGFRVVFSDSSRYVGNFYCSLQKVPSISTNQPVTANIVFTALAESIRYAT